MLTIDRIEKRFGAKRVLRGASLAIERGDVVAIAGDNGAGKSTLLQIVCGAMPPDRGAVRIDGHDIERERVLALSGCGFAPEHADLPPHLRAREWLDLVCAIRGSSDDPFDARSNGHLPVGELSLGQKRRLLLSCAWAGSPRVVVLDEPSNGLDAKAEALLIERIRAQREIGAVLVTTHDMDLAEKLGAKVVRLENGTLR